MARGVLDESGHGQTISAVRVSPAHRDEWDAAAAACSHATYFQTREWAELWQAYTRGALQPAAEKVLFSDARTALLPFSRGREHKGLIQRFLLSPAGTYGDWISEGALSRAHGQALARQILTRRNLTWRTSPFTPGGSDLHAGLGGRREPTHVLDLRPGSDAILEGWHTSHRRNLNRARRNGITTREGSSADDWQCYYRLYCDSLRRWGDAASSRYSRRLFELLCERKSASIKLWLALHGNRPISGMICFYWRAHAVYWHGATAEGGRELQPVHRLMQHVIGHAADEGYRWLDLNPSSGHDGVERFKAGFGARVADTWLIEKGSVTQRAIQRLKKLVLD